MQPDGQPDGLQSDELQPDELQPDGLQSDGLQSDGLWPGSGFPAVFWFHQGTGAPLKGMTLYW